MLSFNEVKKNLKKDFSGFKKIRIALLSDSASQLLAVALRGYGFVAELDLDIYEADYDQIDLQIFDPGSELYSFNPDYIFINKCTEHLLQAFYSKILPDKSALPPLFRTPLQAIIPPYRPALRPR